MKVLLLLSGGIDSPVAGWLVARLGHVVDAIHFSLEPFTDDSALQKARVLATGLGFKRLFVVRQGQQHAEIVNNCTHRYYYVLSRRLMFRVAEAIARAHGYDVLLTGECIGQVGSQTLTNMAAIDSAISIAVLRPLLCRDKEEIIAIAKVIGSYEHSLGPELCCALGPSRPATAVRQQIIEAEEAKLELAALIDASLKNTELECLS